MRTSQCFVRALPSNLIRLLATLLWLLSASTVVMAQVPATERTALVNLYNNTNGSNWNDRTNWLGSAGTECTWSGVTCDNTSSNVIGISLSNNNLVGTLPDLSGLTALQSFAVNSDFPNANQLGGPIPALSALTGLQDFEVNGNQLTGSIPSLAGLTSLTLFSANDNQLTGSIPDLSGLTALQTFTVNGNFFTGSIPSLSGLTALQDFEVDGPPAQIGSLTGPIPSLGGLTSLVKFSALDNQLTGSIPDLSGLTAVRFFLVSSNQLTGAIPDLSTLTALNVFEVSHNQLTGSIPSLSALAAIQTFSVDGNQLTGSIPDLSNLSVGFQFNFSNNQLTGPLPSFSNLPDLQFFYAHDNQLSGPIPSLTAAGSLKEFGVAANQLTGSIPSLSGLTVLHLFSIDNNLLTGTIPSLSGLTALNLFSASHNQLSGPIPSLSGLPLQTFQVNSNQLSGSIPSLSGITTLLVFDVAGNQLTGSIPSLSGLTTLQFIDVGSNQLSGPLPSLSGLVALQTFGARANQLTGPIPTLSGLTALHLFGVDTNQLTGSIPNLSGLTALQTFDVAANQLTGLVPSLSGLSALNLLFVANNQLSGPMALPPSPSALAPGLTNLCANQLQSTGNSAADQAWDVASNSTPVNGTPGWLACQSTHPTRLAVISVNGGTSPTAGASFSVVIQAQDGTSTAQNVVANTTVQLSRGAGTGTLAGTLSCQINAGSNSCTIAGVTYSNAESGVIITATAISGDSLTAANSASFTVNPANVAPTITSAASATFTIGTAGTFTATATGTPAPTLSEAGALPSGVTFNAATGVLSGTPAAGTAGTYPITFTAANGVLPNATQSFTLTVNPANVAPTITSAWNTTFTVGTSGSFTVTSTGTPTPTLSESGTLPSGVIFNAATGVLSGTPVIGSAGTSIVAFTASNGIPPAATQSFTLTINPANVAPAITSAASATFKAGVAGTFTITATGTPSPTLSEVGALPSGVTFNAATGVLSGTPALGTVGSYPFTFTAASGVVPNATQAFTLTVTNPAPVAYAYLSQFGSHGTGNGQFSFPTGVAIDPTSHHIVVLDNTRVEIFDSTGVYLSQFGSVGYQFGVWPAGVAIDPVTHNIVVVDQLGDGVRIYSPTGTLLTQFGSRGTGNGQFSGPSVVAIDPVSGNIIVGDFFRSAQIFSSTGVYLSQFVGAPSPLGLTIDPANHDILIAGQVYSVVEVFDPAGNYIRNIGSSGAGNGQFRAPAGVGIDPITENIVVADYSNYRVQILDTGGDYLGQFGSYGTGNGQFSGTFGGPIALAIDPTSRNVVVADIGGNRIEIFTPTTISLAPNGVAFGNAAIGVTSAVTPLTLTNIGTTPLTVSGIAIVGSNIGDFGQTNTCGGSVGAGASCTINVAFTPQAAGPRSASIQITDSAAGSPRTVPLSGTGVAIVRFGGSVQRALEDQAGNLYVSLIVTNQGNSTVDSVTVNVNGTSLSGPSFVFPLLAPVTLSANLAPGASETFNLVFRDNLPCQLVAGSMTVSGTYVAGAQNGSWKMSFRRIAPGSTCP